MGTSPRPVQCTTTDKPQARSRTLAQLAPHSTAEESHIILAEAVSAAAAITNENWRAQALIELTPHLAPDQIDAAIRAATTITTEDARAQALTGLAPHLTRDQLTTAMQAATTMTTQDARAQALTELPPIAGHPRFGVNGW